MTRPTSRSGRFLRRALLGACAVTTASILAGGCLDRPVAPAVPAVSARVVEKAKQNKVSKLDILFMIDNSSSMADKQTILSTAVPDLVQRLVNPGCIDPKKNNQFVGQANNGNCATGLERDFEPVKDIHIGVISSSLGGHGSTACDPKEVRMGDTTPRDNVDMAHLITRGAPAASVAGGFLNYNPAAGGALKTAAEVLTPFTSLVPGVGQRGCGYEAQLESIYRFLNDPEPYDNISIEGAAPGNPGRAVLNGTDQTVLKQRADFLRPDSLVAVIMVTDENDCSVKDGGQNFYPLLPTPGGTATSPTTVRHGTSVCKTNPNDLCCFNCGQSPPAGCADPKNDPECAAPWTKAEDPENLRCWDQKRRYGVDFLYPTSRYVEALTTNTVYNRAGMRVKNPLFDDLQCKGTNCAAERDPSLIFLAGIVGVPWQDIAKDPTSLLSGFQVASEIDWNKILGDPHPADNKAPILPTDKHMIESITPREGLAGPASAAKADPIHGHEWDVSKYNPPNSDLQYACTFPLPMPKQCAGLTSDCDCISPDPAAPMAAPVTNSPLCQGGQGYSTNQVAAKAYPGTRELEVLRGLRDQAIVASICPEQLSMNNAANYGYRPAVEALINRLRNALRGRCLPRQLEVAEGTKQVPCVIIEAFNSNDGTCDCSLAGRGPAATEAVTDEIKSSGTCQCEIVQLKDNDQEACRSQMTAPMSIVGGWCYVDPAQQAGSCDIVSACAASERRLIKFVNDASQPRAGATAFIMCQEASFPSNGGDVAADPCAPK